MRVRRSPAEKSRNPSEMDEGPAKVWDRRLLKSRTTFRETRTERRNVKGRNLVTLSYLLAKHER